MKNILFIYNKSFLESHSRHIHSHWVVDCQNNYNIEFWGKDFVQDKDLTIKALKRKIDRFKPDYIYLTGRKKYMFKKSKKNMCWLPNLSDIKNVIKIFVEVDSYRYSTSDEWYRQFDKLYCRNNKWVDWKNIPILRWSVSEIAFPNKNISINRKGIYFVGTIDNRPYWYRRKIRDLLFNKINFCTVYPDEYWNILHSASALVCPAEGRIHKDVEYYVPAKLFEYLASGAAVLTNCDAIESGIENLNDIVIKYKDLNDLNDKLDIDFEPYYNKAIEIMRNHTHRVRYKELFG